MLIRVLWDSLVFRKEVEESAMVVRDYRKGGKERNKKYWNLLSLL